MARLEQIYGVTLWGLRVFLGPALIFVLFSVIYKNTDGLHPTSLYSAQSMPVVPKPGPRVPLPECFRCLPL